MGSVSGYRWVRVGGHEWVHDASTDSDHTLGWARAATAQIAVTGEQTRDQTQPDRPGVVRACWT